MLENSFSSKNHTLETAYSRVEKSFLVVTASSYVKLQDAFAAERNAAGGWTLIGYTEPTSNNFTYSGTGIAAGETAELAGLSNSLGWAAVNKVALNDCEVGTSACKWQIQLSEGAKGGQISYSACLSTNAKPLTANFEAIGASATPCDLQ